MEENIVKIKRFITACDELIAGSYRDAEEKISEVLKCLAASEDLTGLFSAVTEEFDYAASKSYYLRETSERRGTAYLPTGRVDALAFVFCLLAEIDAGAMRFNDFLLRYFYVDGSYTASFSLFADRIMRPFRDIVKEAYPACAQYVSMPAMRPVSSLEEKTVQRNVLFEGKIIKLRCDDALLPDGKACKREVVEHPGGAAILCVHEGKVVLVRQFRYAYGEEILEIPAGKLDGGEDPAQAAMRELGEETGLTAKSLTHLLTLYPSPGYTNEKIYIYEAAEVSAGSQHLDGDEFLRVEYVALEDAYDMIARGEIKDAKTIAALLMYKNR